MKELEIIYCRANGAKIETVKPWELGEPVQFMYMPSKISTITAGFRDKAITVTLFVDEQAAETVQASFENLKHNTPKQKPFGCVEHREEEASVHPVEFCWGSYDGDEGILVTAEPTKLGVENVNGKIHRSWSPSFATDADYAKATLKGGVYTFPEGVRGSTSNPARITGIDFCVGTLTNKPAFRNMPPVKAKLVEGYFDDETIQAGGAGSGPRPSGLIRSEHEAKMGALKQHYNVEDNEEGVQVHVKNKKDFPYRICKNGEGGVSLSQGYSPAVGVPLKYNPVGKFPSVSEAVDRIIKKHNKADSYMNWGKIKACDETESDSIFARLQEPTPIDTIFSKLYSQRVPIKKENENAGDILARLSKAGRP